MHESSSHVRAATIIAHLTRNASNTKRLASHTPRLVTAMVRLAGDSPSSEGRAQSCRSLQNLTADVACRQELANEPDLIENLCLRARQGSGEERRSAVGALKNLTDEPANMIPMTNAHDCFATLMQIAHGGGGARGGGRGREG